MIVEAVIIAVAIIIAAAIMGVVILGVVALRLKSERETRNTVLTPLWTSEIEPFLEYMRTRAHPATDRETKGRCAP